LSCAFFSVLRFFLFLCEGEEEKVPEVLLLGLKNGQWDTAWLFCDSAVPELILQQKPSEGPPVSVG